MNDLRESFKRSQLLRLGFIPICELFVIVIVEYSEQCPLSVRADSDDLVLLFPIVLENAAAEVTCTVNRAFSFDFEGQKVKAIDETVRRDQRKIGVIIVKGQRSDEGRGRFNSGQTLKCIRGIHKEILLLYDDEILAARGEFHFVAIPMLQSPILSQLIIKNVHYPHSVYESCSHIVARRMHCY